MREQRTESIFSHKEYGSTCVYFHCCKFPISFTPTTVSLTQLKGGLRFDHNQAQAQPQPHLQGHTTPLWF